MTLLFSSYIVDDLGIKEDSAAYKAVKNIGTSVEAVGVTGIDLIKGSFQLIGRPIGNSLALGNNYAQMQTGRVTEEDSMAGTMTGMPGQRQTMTHLPACLEI